MNKSNAREGDGVADAFRALDAAIAYEGDCTARKALRKARETFAAMQAQQGADSQVIALLVAGGYVTADKVAEARNIITLAAPATGAPR